MILLSQLNPFFGDKKNAFGYFVTHFVTKNMFFHGQGPPETSDKQLSTVLSLFL